MRPVASASRQPTPHRAAVKLNAATFDLITAVLGQTTDAARARFFNLGVDSIYRAREGRGVGEVFIAQTLSTLRQPRHRQALADRRLAADFDSLFLIEAKS